MIYWLLFWLRSSGDDTPPTPEALAFMRRDGSRSGGVVTTYRRGSA